MLVFLRNIQSLNLLQFPHCSLFFWITENHWISCPIENAVLFVWVFSIFFHCRMIVTTSNHWRIICKQSILLLMKIWGVFQRLIQLGNMFKSQAGHRIYDFTSTELFPLFADSRNWFSGPWHTAVIAHSFTCWLLVFNTAAVRKDSDTDSSISFHSAQIRLYFPLVTGQTHEICFPSSLPPSQSPEWHPTFYNFLQKPPRCLFYNALIFFLLTLISF